jgi:glycosyltransferase involved in cell wall biosynthesis
MSQPIDVLIPHYNDPEGLKLSVDSIVGQDYGGEFRIVLVDDGSRSSAIEQARSVLAEAGLAYSWHQNEVNWGRPRTRSRLLRESSAPYLAWLDAGDIWLPAKTRTQMVLLEELEAAPDVDAASVWATCDYEWHWQDGRQSLEVQQTEGDQVRALMEGRKLRGYLWTLLARREAFLRVGDFDERLPRLQDLDFFLRFTELGGRLVKPPSSEPRPLCIYLKSDVGRDARQIYDCNTYLMKKHAELFGRYGRAFERKRRVQAHMLALRFAKNNGQRMLAARFLLGGLLTDPGAAFSFARRKLRERG